MEKKITLKQIAMVGVMAAAVYVASAAPEHIVKILPAAAGGERDTKPL